jgi:hypothetical protein
MLAPVKNCLHPKICEPAVMCCRSVSIRYINCFKHSLQLLQLTPNATAAATAAQVAT